MKTSSKHLHLYVEATLDEKKIYTWKNIGKWENTGKGRDFCQSEKVGTQMSVA